MENVLGSLDGVVDAKADYIAGSATVSYDPARVTPAQMVEAINTKSFYQARLPQAEAVTGQASRRVNFLPFVAGGVLVALAGVGVWRLISRRRTGRATTPHTSSPDQ